LSTSGLVSTATYTPTDPTLGTHVYTLSYSGDANFLAAPSATTASLIVDQADFTVTSTTSPILLVPGIIPGGNAAVANEQAATPETAVVFIAPILGSTATVNLTCAVPASYITCTLSPTSVTLTGTTTMTSTVSVSTPATLPIGFTGSMANMIELVETNYKPTTLTSCTTTSLLRCPELRSTIHRIHSPLGTTVTTQTHVPFLG